MGKARHTFTATGGESGGLVGEAAWNDDHTISVAVSDVIGLVTALDGLDNDIAGEAVARAAADDALSNAVSVVSNALSVETAARVAGDNTLSNAISVVSQALSVETAARVAAVNTVSNAVSVVSQALSVETAARIAAGNVISNAVSIVSQALSVETAARIAADNTISNAVSIVSQALSVETAARITGVNAVSNAVSVVSQALSAETAARVAADNTLSNAISVVSNAISVLSAQMVSVQHRTTRLQGDQTLSTSALVNVSGLSFATVANATYHFKFMVIFRGVATGSGLGITVTTPTFASLGAQATIPAGANGVSHYYGGAITASGTRVQSTSLPASATDYMALIEGQIVTSNAAGTLQLQCGANLSGPTTGQIIVRQGTAGMVWRLA